jgi:hypothetical protein
MVEHVCTGRPTTYRHDAKAVRLLAEHLWRWRCRRREPQDDNSLLDNAIEVLLEYQGVLRGEEAERATKESDDE